MPTSRGVVARALVFVAGIVAAGCSSGGSAPPAGTGGSSSSGGTSGSGGTDAGRSMTDAGSTIDGSTGLDSGTTTKDGGGVNPHLHCGDHVLDPGEQCDDGNKINGDGCDADCRFTCIAGPVGDAVCSDGNFCNGIETCSANHLCQASTTNLPDGTICGEVNKCLGGVCRSATADCGDTLVIAPEECDPPDGKGCGADCRFTCVSTDLTRDCKSTDICAGSPRCDDSTHTCLPGTPLADLHPCGTNLACVSGVCSSKYCGNHVVDPGEECDDGNGITGDGCEPNCKYTCAAGDPLRDCGAPNSCFNAGTCDTSSHVCDPFVPKAAGTGCGTGENCVQGTCRNAVCGDGIVAPSEACDDGNLDDKDGCTNDCKKNTPGCTANCSCQGNGDCDDGDPCNGSETCASNVCAPGTALGDDTACGTGRICIAGGCRLSVCGDGYTDSSIGEECDPPNTGACDANCKAQVKCDLTGTTWGVKIAVNVGWGDGTILEPTTGQLVQWAELSNITQGSDLKLAMKLKPCGLSIPDFPTTTDLGGEWYGVTFADALWEKPGIPVVDATGSLSNRAPGAVIKLDTVVILLGVTFTSPATPLGTWTDPTVAWTDLVQQPGVAVSDPDGDKHDGITANVKTGALPPADKPSSTGQYADVIADLNTPPARADQLYLAVKQVSSEVGSLDSCTSMHGAVTVNFLDNHIVGCLLDAQSGNAACSTQNEQIVDAVRPHYTVSSATYSAAAVPSGATCAAVRAAVP